MAIGNATSDYGPGGGGLATMFARLARRARIAYRDMRQRQTLRRELAECALNGELETTLGELGLSLGQVERLVKGYPESSRLLQAMGRRLGVDRIGVKDILTLREMQRSCSLCPSHAECRHWLRSGEGEGYHAFCPNAGIFDELRGLRAR